MAKLPNPFINGDPEFILDVNAFMAALVPKLPHEDISVIKSPSVVRDLSSYAGVYTPPISPADDIDQTDGGEREQPGPAAKVGRNSGGIHRRRELDQNELYFGETRSARPVNTYHPFRPRRK